MQKRTPRAGRPLVPGDHVPGTPYRVVGVAGAAHTGTVYEVEHIELGKRFALKALPPTAARFDMVARLRNEWRALARLAHPNIVAVSDAGTTSDGLPFFVMERLDGETLRARLDRERRLRVSEAIGIAASVADALGAAHRVGVVHRDVKPESIFLARGGCVKLFDFGLAKLHSAPSKLTARGVTIGTPRYMAPEQALGERVDHRADFYALGLVLFEMLAGGGPFDDAEDTDAMLLRRTTGEAPSLATLAAGLPAELDALIARMLARHSDERPPDAHSVASALRQAGTRLFAPVSHDSPTRDGCYSATTRPMVAVAPCEATPTVQLDAAPGEDTPTTQLYAVQAPAAAEQTVPDGVATRQSAPAPAPVPVLSRDNHATALAVPVPRRDGRATPLAVPVAGRHELRAIPPPLPDAVPGCAPTRSRRTTAAHSASTPPSAAVAIAIPTPARGSSAPSRHAVTRWAALIGTGAAVLFLGCLALGWVFPGNDEVIASRRLSGLVADATGAHGRPAGPAPMSKPAPPSPVAPTPTLETPTRKRSPKRARHRAPPRHRAPAQKHSGAPRAESTAVTVTSNADRLLCHPDIPPNPYGVLPPSGL